jgi:GNAT superfamily N-acetyltransferase
MVEIVKTDSENTDFIELVRNLDADLAERDGDDHAFYSKFNKLDKIKFVAVAYDNEKPVACGAMKKYAANTMEIKRMYVAPEYRGKGFANKILSALENWASELSYTKCMLETGKRQPEAIRLYEKNGYSLIPNYGQYVGVENSLCFEKKISNTVNEIGGYGK